jgi:hypothetical protein
MFLEANLDRANQPEAIAENRARARGHSERTARAFERFGGGHAQVSSKAKSLSSGFLDS